MREYTSSLEHLRGEGQRASDKAGDAAPAMVDKTSSDVQHLIDAVARADAVLAEAITKQGSNRQVPHDLGPEVNNSIQGDQPSTQTDLVTQHELELVCNELERKAHELALRTGRVRFENQDLRFDLNRSRASLEQKQQKIITLHRGLEGSYRDNGDPEPFRVKARQVVRVRLRAREEKGRRIKAKQESAVLRDQLRACKEKVRRLHSSKRLLNSVLASRSWRFTRVFRGLRRFFKRSMDGSGAI